MNLNGIYSRIVGSAVLITAVMCLLHLPGAAQQNDKLKELQAIFDELKGLKTYSYAMELHAVFPDGSKDKIHSEIFMDKVNSRLYYETDLQVVLLNKKWFYQVEHRSKKVRIFDVAKYNKKYKDRLPELGELFETDAVSLFIDSFLVQFARIKSYSREGNIATFRLSFPENSYLEEFELKYDYSTRLPRMLKLKTRQSSGMRDEDENQRKSTTYEYICTRYSRDIPEKVFDLVQFFTVKDGKATLLKYKDYKLFTII